MAKTTHKFTIEIEHIKNISRNFILKPDYDDDMTHFPVALLNINVQIPLCSEFVRFLCLTPRCSFFDTKYMEHHKPSLWSQNDAPETTSRTLAFC